jgi:hypothetical protein
MRLRCGNFSFTLTVHFTRCLVFSDLDHETPNLQPVVGFAVQQIHSISQIEFVFKKGA